MLSTKDEAPIVRTTPKIDLTLFTTGDGTVVSTKERIIKGKNKTQKKNRFRDTNNHIRGAGTSSSLTYRRTILE